MGQVESRQNGNKLSAVFMIAGLYFFGLRLRRFLYLMLFLAFLERATDNCRPGVSGTDG